VEILLYLVVDASGSTVRHGFHGGAVRALPTVVADIEWATGGAAWLSVLSYAGDADLLVPMTRVNSLTVVPVPRAGGLSSLAAAFRLLATTIARDAALLAADGLSPPRPTVLVVADDLPTDRDDDLLEARDKLDADLHVALPADVAGLPVAGLRATRHRLELGTSEQVSASISEAVRRILGA